MIRKISILLFTLIVISRVLNAESPQPEFPEVEHGGQCQGSRVTTLSEQTRKATEQLLVRDLGANWWGLVDHGGVRVHQSCRQLYFTSMFSSTREAFVEGAQCIQNLRRDALAARPQRTTTHLDQMLSRLDPARPSSPRVSIRCDEHDHKIFKLFDHVAYGTPNDTYPGHPLISLNPKGTLPPLRLARTIFHESIHTSGFVHGESLEIAYTCGAHCFPDPSFSVEQKQLARELCEGNFQGPEDPNYLIKLADFTRLHRIHGLQLIFSQRLRDNRTEQNLELVRRSLQSPNGEMN